MATTDRTNTSDKTPAQLYSLVFGAILLAVGILGFIADSSFDTGGDVDGSNFIVFEVNGWHNLVHILSGILGLAMAKRRDTARTFALGFGLVYLIVTIWGFATGDQVLGLLPVNAADNVLHLLIAAAGLAAGLASPSDSTATRTRTA